MAAQYCAYISRICLYVGCRYVAQCTTASLQNLQKERVDEHYTPQALC